MSRQTRVNFGKVEKNLPKFDLPLVQRQSWDWFLTEGISKEIAEVSPIDDFTGKNWRLIFSNHSLGEHIITPRVAREKGLTFSSPFKVIATLVNKHTEKEVSQEVFLGDIPQMTKWGTFIVNGIERAVINQIVRSPGAYFSGNLDALSGRMLYISEIRPLHGSWLEFEVGKSDVIVARIDRRKRVPVTVFLRAMGLSSDEEIKKTFAQADIDKNHQYIQKTLEKDSTKSSEEALIEIYRKMRPGEPSVLENAQELFEGLFLDPRRYDLGKVGRYKINKKLGLNVENEKKNWVLTKNDVVGALNYLIGLQNNQGKVDDIAHLANRRLRRVGELVATHAFRVGFLRLERSIKEKMSLVSTADRPLPSQLINARPLIAAINEFFRSNQLSTILDDTNPLSEIDNLRRVSVLGPGGINRERASFSIRDVNSSQYGRIDPVRSPEGPNIGLVTYLAIYAKVNKYGFIETPYRKLEKVKKDGKARVRVTNEMVYLSADDEEEYRITHNAVNQDRYGYINQERVAFRYKGEFLEGPSELTDLIDVTPRQVFGASAALIPFLAHDDGIRALMGSNMQCQAVPLVNPSAPVVGTGMEEEIASAMGRVTVAKSKGEVTYVDADKIELKIAGGEQEVYQLTKFRRTAHSTCYNQRAVVKVGDKAKVGDLLAEGP